MNSLHDVGGMHGFGPVARETDEPVFHAPWEGRVMALYRAVGFLRAWTIDAGRAAIERLPPATYLMASYYEKWLMGLEANLERAGLVGADEIEIGRALRPGKAPVRPMTVEDVANIRRGNFERPATAPARFRPGSRIRTVNLNPSTHTRLPRYARDKQGVVEAVRGCHVFPDSAAIDAGENPQWLYTVVFFGRDLWGPQADPTVSISIEAFEPYLVAA